MTTTVMDDLSGEAVVGGIGWDGDYMRHLADSIRNTPGTFWERVGESGIGRGSALYWSTLRTILHMPAPQESIRQRVGRIAHDQNISFNQAFRVALAGERLERAKTQRRYTLHGEREGTE